MKNTYTTISGDTWDLISFKIYGDEKYMNKLVEANIELASTVFFKAGVKLQVPQIKNDLNKNAPPWKKI